MNSDGSFDTSFGNNGVVVLASTPGVLALLSDGKLLLTGGGGGTGSSIVQRYDTNGQLDTGFGTGGSAPLVGLGPIALQSDAKILIPSTGFSLASLLVRYNTNGSLDTRFGSSGQASAVATPAAVAVQTDRNMLTAGSVVSKLSLNGNTLGFGLTRFHSDGRTDTTFGKRGSVSTTFPNSSNTGANALVIQPNGDIVAAGSAETSGNQAVSSFALARYLSTGKLDNTFGNGGLVTTSFGNAAASISAAVLQSDGKIVFVGSNGGGDLVVARYLGQ